ncbi:hypothetical protein [Enterobacter sp. CC120223-11]|uniref:hypothetical protein n=1 Tax=Enterobacter sp. CC120223-11 TaxID=1378073 RepID=UPI000BD689D5|nr:hypothetical protein [Enterobacter sp. CC120223-11]SNY59747.1 hypothetical protein SAMN02744775_00327 [Enterobacter sp. CC120223-11]
MIFRIFSFFIYLKTSFLYFFRRLDWQAASVIVAMILFGAQIGYNTYDKWKESSDNAFKMRVILLSEINNNLMALATGGDDSQVLGTYEICIPLPAGDTEAIKRVAIAVSYLHDEVYFSQLEKLASLPKKEVDAIVKSYYSLSRLRTLSTQLEFNINYSPSKVKLMRDEYYNLYSLTSSLSNYLAHHTENP